MSTNQDNSTGLLSGHRQRLRQRLENDPASVADYEVMELILGLSITRKDTKLLALRLMDRFGGIRGALDARPDELEQVPGFGAGLQAHWRLLRELLARYVASPLLKREVLASSEAVAKVARQRLSNMANEESWLALVDAQNHLISWERLRQGGVSSVAIQPRDVLELAIKRKASGIILVHNHPGGSSSPSSADLSLTRELEALAPRLGLRLLDHVIVTAGDCYSIAQSRILQVTGENNV